MHETEHPQHTTEAHTKPGTMPNERPTEDRLKKRTTTDALKRSRSGMRCDASSGLL